MTSLILEIMYIMAGIILMMLGIATLAKSKDFISSGFWLIFGIVFTFGKYLPASWVGALLVLLAGLSATKKIKKTTFHEASAQEKQERSQAIGSRIFIPALSIGVITFLVAKLTPLGGLVGLGIASAASLIVAMIITKSDNRYLVNDSLSLLQQMGPVLILPQLLSSLGAIFVKVDLGTFITESMVSLIPENNRLVGVIIYCVSMALFTIIMGNAFAAFAFITAGIGYPFVIAVGGNPVIVSALGLTAGYCGTLMTPMAANFNILPATVLEMNNKSLIILTQLPIALIMLALHITLMYFWAF